jgi:CheY-like chemotaxis protein
MHGGGVSLQSDGVPGKGSRFTVSLPWREATEVDEPSAEQRVIPGRPTESTEVPPTDQGPLILLAEDHESNIETIADYLQAKGYRLTVARDGVEAIERTRQERPDLILMDIQMPHMDGLEAIRRLRTEEGQTEVPIIALTALAMPGDCERCLEAGASEYLSKPVSMRQLVRTIQAQLGQETAKRSVPVEGEESRIAGNDSRAIHYEQEGA